MIASPCRTCGFKNQPKDSCLTDCEQIQAMQEYAEKMVTAGEGRTLVSSINYGDMGRYVIGKFERAD